MADLNMFRKQFEKFALSVHLLILQRWHRPDVLARKFLLKKSFPPSSYFRSCKISSYRSNHCRKHSRR